MSCLLELFIRVCFGSPHQYQYQGAESRPMTEEEILTHLGAFQQHQAQSQPVLNTQQPPQLLSTQTQSTPVITSAIDYQPPASYSSSVQAEQLYSSPIRYQQPNLYDNHYCSMLIGELERRRRFASESVDHSMIAQIITLNQWIKILENQLKLSRVSMAPQSYTVEQLYTLDWYDLYEHCGHVMTALTGHYQ